jgi:hypothetical protein
MKYYYFLLFFLLPVSSFATEIVWHEPQSVSNLGYFSEKPPENPSFPDFWYYESMTHTFSIAEVKNDKKNIGEIFLMLPNLQAYRGQERLYIFHTASGNAIIEDISSVIESIRFIKKPAYIKSAQISRTLQRLNLPKKIYKTSIEWYSLEFLPINVDGSYIPEKYNEVGTFFNTKTRKNEPLYTETSSWSANGFYIKRPDGTMALYMPHLAFLSNKPQIIWNDGKRRNWSYVEQDSTVCGSLPTSSLLRVVTDQGAPILVWKNSDWAKVEWIPFDEKDLQKIWKTKTWQDIYILSDDNPAYQIYYDKYFPENMNWKAKPFMKDFIKWKPFLFYKDNIGRYIFLLNTAYYIPMFCA